MVAAIDSVDGITCRIQERRLVYPGMSKPLGWRVIIFSDSAVMRVGDSAVSSAQATPRDKIKKSKAQQAKMRE